MSEVEGVRKPIEERLADVAEAAENDDADRTYYRSRRKPVDPSQVYSIRIPVDRLEEVRALAAAREVRPTTMLRDWIIERLDQQRPTMVFDWPISATDLAASLARARRLGPLRLLS